MQESFALRGLLSFVIPDLFFAVVATLVFSGYNVYELRRRGLITTKQALCVAALALPANVFMGPGVAVAGLWWWRETLLGAVRSQHLQEGKADQKRL